MKDFFKKHPELLIILIAVIIIDAGIIWMSLSDQAHTAKSKKKLLSLIEKAERISTSKLRTNSQNAEKAELNAESVQKAFKEKFLQKLNQYKYIKHPKENFSNQPNAKLNMQKLLDNLIEVTLKDIDLTEDKLSFNQYYQKAVMDMENDKITQIFQILNGFTRIAHNCAEAEIASIDSVQRPIELGYTEDKKLGIKTYTYIVNVTGNGSSIKRLLNRISSDEKYFYEISSIKLKAVDQITTDENGNIAPIVGRAAKAEKERPDPKDFDFAPEDKPAPKESDIYVSESSLAPFTRAENKVELTIDWIQFVKPKTGKKTK
jgi:hypothetical protein